MNRLQTLESHVVSSNPSAQFVPKVNLLDKYRKMSSLQSEFIKQQLNHQVDLKLQEKFENIFKDRRHFEPYTYEEMDRKQQRESVNVKVLRYLKESSKFVPLSEAFNDIGTWCAMCEPAIIYNDSITTKMSVNF